MIPTLLLSNVGIVLCKACHVFIVGLNYKLIAINKEKIFPEVIFLNNFSSKL